jgi:hypothetical protein
VDHVEVPGPLEEGGDVEALGDFRTESAVANNVTSCPAATRPSVSRDAKSSQGP